MQNHTIAEIASVWKSAKTVVVFTGAGMSTESGLPDFRSEQGLWKQRPESLATLQALEQTPDEFYFFYQWRIQRLTEVYPNAGHLVLALMEKIGLVKHVITQNVDGLHQLAGSDSVAALHGTLKTVSCLKCQSHYDSRQLVPLSDSWELDYKDGWYAHGVECRCPQCGGRLRPDVVLFGEALPQEPWQVAQDWCRKADLFVVIGSSLVVSPANNLPRMVVEAGAKLLIINESATPLDHLAAWRLGNRAAEVLPVICAAVNDGVGQEYVPQRAGEEIVFSGAVEGGEMKLQRRTFGNGAREFFIRVNNAMWFDDDDVDIGPVVKETRFASWNGAWEYLKPTLWYQQAITIHPDYQRFFREHFNEIEAAVPKERYTMWRERYLGNWVKALHGETTF